MFKYINTKYQTWIRLFLILFIEIIIPWNILMYLINKKTIVTLSNLENTSVIIFILFWIFISYLRGRYSQIKIRDSLKNYILKIRELISISIILSLTLFFLKIINIDLYFFSKNLPLIFLIFISLSFLNELFFNKIINTIIPHKFERIFILGSKTDLNEIRYTLSNYDYKNNIEFEAIEDNYDLTEIPNKLIIS